MKQVTFGEKLTLVISISAFVVSLGAFFYEHLYEITDLKLRIVKSNYSPPQDSSYMDTLKFDLVFSNSGNVDAGCLDCKLVFIDSTGMRFLMWNNDQFSESFPFLIQESEMKIVKLTGIIDRRSLFNRSVSYNSKATWDGTYVAINYSEKYEDVDIRRLLMEITMLPVNHKLITDSTYLSVGRYIIYSHRKHGVIGLSQIGKPMTQLLK